MTTLSNDEIRRYARHLIMPEVGMSGQRRLKGARVLLVGTGGLGSPAAMYLAAAGVGTIGLVDYDVVDASNLQRQIIHGERTVGKRKVDSAAERLKDLNPFIKVEKHNTLVDSGNALELFRNYDVIADGTDNFPTRYLVNDACVLLGKPNVYASIFRFEGQVSVFDAKRGPCYRCLYAEPPPPGLVPSCAEGGVFGVLPGVMGSLQATEVIKLLLDLGDPLIGRLLTFDALTMKVRELKLRKDPHCKVCSPHATVKELIDYVQFCGVPSHDHEADGTVLAGLEVTVRQLAERQKQREAFKLIDVREPHEAEIANLPGAQLIPLGELPGRLHELDSRDDLVVFCKTGARSMKAVQLLRDAGFSKVKNLRGGINAWSREIDKAVPLY